MYFCMDEPVHMGRASDQQEGTQSTNEYRYTWMNMAFKFHHCYHYTCTVELLDIFPSLLPPTWFVCVITVIFSPSRFVPHWYQTAVTRCAKTGPLEFCYSYCTPVDYTNRTVDLWRLWPRRDMIFAMEKISRSYWPFHRRNYELCYGYDDILNTEDF